MIGSPAAVAPDAAIALGIAATAMPFARTPEAESERWLRILRAHGEAGAALQALGVSEGRLGEPDRDAELEHPQQSADRRSAVSPIAQPPAQVERVIEEAVEIARRRGHSGVATTDLLLAVMYVYGEDFDRVLQAHGADRDELFRRLGGAPV